jgi:hypothetical protein
MWVRIPPRALACTAASSLITDSLRRRVFSTATGLIALEGALFTLVIPALPEFVDRYGLSTSTPR